MKALLLVIIVSLTCASIASADPTAKKKKAVTSSSKKGVKKANEKQKPKHDIEEINRSLEKLSLNYLGNDPKSVYFAIKK